MDARRVAWSTRQRSMLAQYRELVADREHAALAYRNDYDPLAPVLSQLSGRVVDVGGGPGIARDWLPASARYVCIEPEPDWNAHGWERLADSFPSLARPPETVRSTAERLALRDACADAVLAIFSLNHFADPARGLAEMARVLRPGGRLVLVLDDLPPRWRDLALGGSYTVRDAAERRRLRARWLWTLVTGYGTEPDHLPIRERQLAAWTAPLDLLERRWRGAYLCCVYAKR